MHATEALVGALFQRALAAPQAGHIIWVFLRNGLSRNLTADETLYYLSIHTPLRLQEMVWNEECQLINCPHEWTIHTLQDIQIAHDERIRFFL